METFQGAGRTSPYYSVDLNCFPVGAYFISTTNRYVSFNECIINHVPDVDGIISYLKDNGFKEVYDERTLSTRGDHQHRMYSKVVNYGDTLGATIIELRDVVNKEYDKEKKQFVDKDRSAEDVNIYSNMSTEDIEKISSDIKKFLTIRKKEKKNNIALIVQTKHGYQTQDFELPKNELELDLNYGESFTPIHDKILSTLNADKSKGLVLLHGEPGTGKTHYLKHLASLVEDKQVLFVPPYLVDFITSPEMTPFLIENSNSILFIEDAERVITDRSENGANGVSNILNLTDGILGDILNIQIVATFNMDRKKIDSALLRKGRLIAEHKFDKLSAEDSNKLIKHLGFDHEATDEMALTEIYNLKEVEYKSKDKTRKIGF